MLGIVLAAGLGIVTYSVQKRIDRRHELRKVKEEAYSAYLKALYLGVTEGTTEELKREHSLQYFTLFAVASDEALKRTGDLWTYLRDHPRLTDDDREAVNKRFVEMFRAMRKDCFEETKLDGRTNY